MDYSRAEHRRNINNLTSFMPGSIFLSDLLQNVNCTNKELIQGVWDNFSLLRKDEERSRTGRNVNDCLPNPSYQ